MTRLSRGVLTAVAVEAAAIVLLFGLVRQAHAQEAVTSDQVIAWIDAYSLQDATTTYPYDALYRDSLRVARCESIRFDVAVLNNARLGSRGEVGAFQFMPGPRSIFWSTPTAAAGWDMWDAEANVAAAVWLISRGNGPRHWSCW
jgi:hypothetical protein